MSSDLMVQSLSGFYLSTLSNKTQTINMKLSVFFFLAAFVCAALAAPAEPQVVKILRSAFDLDPAGSYNFGFETEDKITRDETGELKVVKNEEGKDEQVVVVRGSFSYPGPEGKLISVTFFADETGFHPEGEHLPTVARK